MTFDNKDVVAAIAKLDSIKNALTASLKNEAAEAKKHDVMFNEMLANLKGLQREWEHDRAEANADLSAS
jgi:hypothetical protein